MKTWLLCVLLLLSAAARPVYAVEQFEGVQYTLPTGWVTARQEGALIVRPGDATDDAALMLLLTAPTSLNGKSFRAWFDDSLAASAGGSKAILTEGQVMAQRVGALERLSTARAVQYGGGPTRVELYYAVSADDRAVMLMGVISSQSALDRYGASLRSFFDSLSLPDARAAAGAPAPAPAVEAPGGESVVRSGLVGGKPQGLFIGVSVLSGNPVFLLFLERGRFTDRLPPQGLNSIDWDALVKDFPNSTGQWSVVNERLTLRWRNGGVWEDAIVPTTTGMRFNGKGYSAAATVDLARTAGRFEGAQSTAWLNPGGGGPSLTRSTTITLDGKGGFTFDSATGGDVGNAVAFGSAAFSGTVSSMAYEAIFRLRNGRVVSASAVRFPDDDAFILNGTYYQRKP